MTSLNILMLSVGRKTQLIDFFKQELQGLGNVIAADADFTAAGLYKADVGYVIPMVKDSSYLEAVMEICTKENVKGIVSLIDPELNIISKHKYSFERMGITVFISEQEVIDNYYDKYRTYHMLSRANFRVPRTYISLPSFNRDYREGIINYPIVVKPRTGCGAIGFQLINTDKELKENLSKTEDMIIQEYIDGISIDVDFYADIITGQVTSVFAKNRIHVRSGVSDKAISWKDEELFALISSVVDYSKLRGPLCADVIFCKNDYYIIEINPRFGGSYPMAHKCGVNFPLAMIRNLKGLTNPMSVGNYEEDMYLIKEDAKIIARHKTDLFKGKQD